MKKYEGKILPETHPESVRVKLITKNIIEALQRGLRYGDGVQAKKGSKILVVDEPTVNAICMPGGKIVVFTGLLHHFRSDAEVATILAHENLFFFIGRNRLHWVGYIMAIHGAQKISNRMCFLFLRIILCILFGGPTTTLNEIYKYFLIDLPFTRRYLLWYFTFMFFFRREKEADYIGLLLLASAGYDPRGAPQVYEKLDELWELGSSQLDYISTHPSGKTRAQLLSQDKFMEEAISIYRESSSRKGIRRRVWFSSGFWDNVPLLCFTYCFVLCC
ncbi:hypothetical protein MKX01_041435 [Papaver californicum]|nr:hypothetical protein MKX01_041435 [Papaver californicum]